MKKINIIVLIIILLSSNIYAQVVLSADGPGNTYELINSILAPGATAVESPDCGHTEFGRHIQEVWDSELNKYVFDFVIHVTPDNDRCIKYDRQRVEIKTYSLSPDNLKATEGEIVTYKWKFKLPSGFQPSNSFTHIFQIKPVGGDDDSLPIFTLTPRKGTPNKLEFNYIKNSSSSQEKLTTVDLADFENTWVEVTQKMKISEHGFCSIVVKKVSDETVLLQYENSNISTIRTGNDFIRPKWGIYRSLANSSDLRDESVLFADFSIEEEENPLKIFLKLDDMAVNNSATPSLPTLDYLLENYIKASFGLVATRNDDTILSFLESYLNATNTSSEKLFEIWHHGYDHINPEFRGTTYEYQKQHFEDADEIMSNLLRLQMHTFGAPFNQTDETTNTVISENSNYKVTYFTYPAPDVSTGILNLTNRVNMESSTGVLDFDYFVTNYNANKDAYTDYMVLQGHPNLWDESDLQEFIKILDFLIFEGCEFDLPYDYYLELHPEIATPTQTQSISLPSIPTKALNNPDFDPLATASSGLPVLYNSSNPDVATIVDNKIHIVDIGTSIITASQPGNSNYKPANYVSTTLEVTEVILEPSVSTLPAYENFDYDIGTKIIEDDNTIGVNFWSTTAANSNSDVVVVQSPSWSSIDGIKPSTGNAIQFQGSGVNPEFLFTPQTGNFGTIYMSALIKVTALGNLNTTGQRVFGFGKQNSGGSISGATHFFVRLDAGEAGYNIGVNNTNSASSITWDSAVYNVDAELMIVLYFDDSNTGTTAKMWINPTIGGTEPTPTLTDPDSRNLDVDRIQIYQHNSTNTPEMIFDELRIGSTWSSVTNTINNYTWTGATDNNWQTSTNWDTGVVPTNQNNVIIPENSNPVISATTSAQTNNLNIDESSHVTIDSGGSLRVSGTATGNLNYNVHIPDNKWHLISSPVNNEQFDDSWIVNNQIASGTNNNRAIAIYDNSYFDTTTGYWRYFQAGSSATTFSSGIGYSLKRNTAGNYTFTGTYQAGDILPSITKNSNDWNLIANPYAAYLSISDFLTDNTDNLSPAYLAIYIWDPNDGNSGAYKHLTTGYLSPGQAFFINAAVNGTVSFTEEMQSHQTDVSFFKSSEPSIELYISDDENSKKTTINFIESKTKGLDKAFDIGLFDGVDDDLRIYSELLENNNGISLIEQALPNSDLENLVVPIGVKAPANKEITFTANIFNLPNGVKVYIEDRIENTFNELKENTSYTINLNESLNGVGRFYLHTKSSILNTQNSKLNDINIYQTTSSKLKIVGLPNEFTNVKIFNILGKQVLQKNLMGESEINISNLDFGVYLINFENGSSTLHKKIVILK